MTGRFKLIFIISIMTLTAMLLSVAIATGLARSESTDEAHLDPEISASEAKEIALNAAKVDVDDATVIRRKLTTEGDTIIYDICFYVSKGDDSVHYDYVVNAMTGEVVDSKKTVKRSRSVKYKAENGSGSGSSQMDGKTESTDYIGVDEAKRKTLYDSGLERNEVIFKKVELKQGDGTAYYDVEFQSQDIEYEFDVDAITGKVIRREIEYPDDDEGYDD